MTHLYDELCNSLPVPTFTLERNGLIIQANPACARLLGSNPSQLTGKPLREFIAENQHPDLDSFLSRVFTSRPQIICELELALKTPSPRIMQVTASLAPDGEKCHAVMNDIRRHSKDKAIQQARLRLLECAATHTLQELLVATLDEAEQLTGSRVGFYHFIEADQNTLSLQAWSTRTTTEMCKAEGKNRHYALGEAGVWADSLRERKPIIHNDYASLPHRKGLPQGHAPVIREMSVPISRHDRIVAILGLGNKATDYEEEDVATTSLLADLAWDITERKQAEEAMRETNFFLEESQQAAFIGSYKLDFASGYWKSSEVLNRIFGLDGNYNRTVQGWLDIVHPEDRTLMDLYFREQVVALCQQFDKEYRIIRPNDGQIRWVHGLGTLTYDTEHAPRSMIGVIQDITDRKQLDTEKARIEAQYQQIQKAESLNRMAGAIAHNFNNQLQALLGNLELAMGNLPPESPIIENLTDAMMAGRKAAELSGQMLAYLGQIPGKNVPLDLSDACRQQLSTLRSTLPREVELREDLPARGPTIKANLGQIRQILGNLITNAWESFDSNRGTIHLSVKTLPSAQISASHRFPMNWHPHQDDYACLEIRDSGCGITATDIGNIFDPFFTSKFTGRGLGLPVTLGIVRSYGGGITVDSMKGHGSTFRLFFPLSTAPSMPPPDNPPGHPAEVRGNGVILIVEDQPEVSKTARLTLTRLGFSVLEAQDGIDAVELFRQHKDSIRCVLCDLTMKRMDGWATLAALRHMTPGLPAILCSGYNQAEVMSSEHAEWPQIFLHKPYQAAELREAIRLVLYNKTSRNQT
ncbi:MAG: GAF domain-containing protein [bacterium]